MYCCPVERPGRLPEPYHLPGYGGHIPSIKMRNGGTFGRLSRDSIEDPCVAQAPCPVLLPPQSKCCPPNTNFRNPVGCEDIGCCDPVCCPPPRLAPKKKKPPCEEMPCDPCKIMEFFPPHSNCCQPMSMPRSNGRGCGAGNACGGGGERPMQMGAAMNIRAQSCGGGGGGMSMQAQSCGGGGMNFQAQSRGGGGMSCSDPCGEEPQCEPRQGKGRLEPTSYYNCGPSAPPCCTDAEARAHHLNRGPYACPCKPEPDNNIYRCCEGMSSSYAGHIPGYVFHSMGRTNGKASWGTKQYMNKCLYFNTFTKP